MSKVRIVGGGLTGVLAAFEAHRLGARHIELHERYDALGGAALSTERHGLELRDGWLAFGPPGDPARELLESQGLAFEDVEDRFGSVSPGADGEPVYTEQFAGPVLPCPDLGLRPAAGASLAERLAAYPEPLRGPLVRCARWHLGAALDQVHAAAAVPMGIDRVLPVNADPAGLAELRRREPLAEELYGLPDADGTVALPAGGFGALFRDARRALEGLGVVVCQESLVSPRAALAEHQPGEVLVWAADPTPLFKIARAPAPKLFPKTFATYVYGARWSGPTPFRVQDFTGEGACFRAYVYESAGRALVAAECVREADDAEVRYEVHRLLEGFNGHPALGQMLGMSMKPRWTYPSMDAITRLGELRPALAERFGSGFVAGAWETHSLADKLADISAGLASALTASGSAPASAVA